MISKYSHYYPLCLGFTTLSIGIVMGLYIISSYSYLPTFLLIIQAMFQNFYSIWGFIIIGIGLLMYFQNKSNMEDKKKLKAVKKRMDSSYISNNLSGIEDDIFKYLSINYGKPFSSQTLLKRKTEFSIANDTITESNLKDSLEVLYKQGLIKRDFIEKEYYYYFIK